MGIQMSPTVIREICDNADTFGVEMVITFCSALERLRSLGFYNEVEAIENLVSILFLRLLDIYSPTNTYI